MLGSQSPQLNKNLTTHHETEAFEVNGGSGDRPVLIFNEAGQRVEVVLTADNGRKKAKKRRPWAKCCTKEDSTVMMVLVGVALLCLAYYFFKSKKYIIGPVKYVDERPLHTQQV